MRTHIPRYDWTAMTALMIAASSFATASASEPAFNEHCSKCHRASPGVGIVMAEQARGPYRGGRLAFLGGAFLEEGLRDGFFLPRGFESSVSGGLLGSIGVSSTIGPGTIESTAGRAFAGGGGVPGFRAQISACTPATTSTSREAVTILRSNPVLFDLMRSLLV